MTLQDLLGGGVNGASVGGGVSGICSCPRTGGEESSTGASGPGTGTRHRHRREPVRRGRDRRARPGRDPVGGAGIRRPDHRRPGPDAGLRRPDHPRRPRHRLPGPGRRHREPPLPTRDPPGHRPPRQRLHLPRLRPTPGLDRCAPHRLLGRPRQNRLRQRNSPVPRPPHRSAPRPLDHPLRRRRRPRIHPTTMGGPGWTRLEHRDATRSTTSPPCCSRNCAQPDE